jgi:GTP-binding protein
LSEVGRFGFGKPYPISAIHSHGIGDLLDEVIKDFPITGGKSAKERKKEAKEEALKRKEKQKDKSRVNKPESIRVAVVGQPNVGKSSFLNAILKEKRAVVSDVPGTTHDPIDHRIKWKGLIDSSYILTCTRQ